MILKWTFHSLAIFTFFYALASYANPPKTTILSVYEDTITVNGKQSKVFAIKQPNGTFGYSGTQGELFDVTVENKTKVPLVLHWHGILSPNPQDGVPYVTQLPIPAGGQYHYQFQLKQVGTYWLHSHYKLQEQKLMAAPLIIHEKQAQPAKEVLMFLQDFSYEDPREIYQKLRNKLQKQSMPKGPPIDKPDVTDVKFDAYLTNHKTLQQPDIIRVSPKEKIHLRIINASASSNYFIDLGKLKGQLTAVDAAPIKSLTGSRFQIAIGDRLDIFVTLPPGEGAYPILALPEGTKQQTGLILATAAAKLPTLSETTKQSNAILDYSQEFLTQALHPFPNKPIKRSLIYNLEGDMQKYVWMINKQVWPFITPYIVKPNERIEMLFNNNTSMAHPMHLHGHIFQITEINGKKINGRQGDTIDVMPHSTVKVILDTDNDGIWMLHCHVLYHQQGGMMTTVNYLNYPNKFTTKEREEGDQLYNKI